MSDSDNDSTDTRTPGKFPSQRYRQSVGQESDLHKKTSAKNKEKRAQKQINETNRNIPTPIVSKDPFVGAKLVTSTPVQKSTSANTESTKRAGRKQTRPEAEITPSRRQTRSQSLSLTRPIVAEPGFVDLTNIEEAESDSSTNKRKSKSQERSPSKSVSFNERVTVVQTSSKQKEPNHLSKLLKGIFSPQVIHLHLARVELVLQKIQRYQLHHQYKKKLLRNN